MKKIIVMAISLSLYGTALAQQEAKSLASTIAAPSDPIGFCKAVLDQGLFDQDSLTFNTASFILNRNTICKSDYSKFDEAHALAASGGFDIPGVFGISGSDAEASQRYEETWHNYCQAQYDEVQNNSSLRSIAQHASAAILGSFDHCIDVLGERTVRYIKPTDAGSGFTIFIEKHVNGYQEIQIEGIDMLDNETGQPLPISGCYRNNEPLSISLLPLKSNGSNQLSVLCAKPKNHSISVKVTSSAGDVPTVTVPASPPAPPSLVDRVQILENKSRSLAELIELSSSSGDIIGSSLDKASFLAKRGPAWQLCDGTNNTVDLQGRFPRGFANTLPDGLNANMIQFTSEGLGKKQEDQMQQHTHVLWPTDGPAGFDTGEHFKDDGDNQAFRFGYANPNLTGDVRGARTGAETRPKSTIINFFCRIK
ncbi:Uncharacterised protein [Burkholderia pseudomallei]|uniref:hypothetical protein n=1 Tax=Burkholderia pseudomallei TaxID=28450 RepID=UPI000F1CAF7F|nr:hypothetical protein [Burkholderia pseudomallei]CAJ5252584.1 Uncharacterised protein [Burkholderia pseudomallei]CAJ7457880.1 Uncharacterised protein [Burkholderia pseudomallei]CAK0390609.1 Uncharacterised protein [Burkholderia pseudomallei]VCH00528.1 Uncharacterised protein [Burkholderia pseudomallei]VCH60081.1 Uncharacterised protein [Burkholderia pseudomallei]